MVAMAFAKLRVLTKLERARLVETSCELSTDIMSWSTSLVPLSRCSTRLSLSNLKSGVDFTI